MSKTIVALVLVLFATSNLIPSASAAGSPIKKLSGDDPDYPPRARRLNIAGEVLVQVLIGADGVPSDFRVLKSPADILSNAVITALRTWRFAPLPEPMWVTIPVPYKLSGDDDSDYAFDVAIRHMEKKPASALDIPGGVIAGSCVIRLILDEDGKVLEAFTLKVSKQDFLQYLNPIIEGMKFSPHPNRGKSTKREYRTQTVNEFSIQVNDALQISIEQRSGAAGK